MIGRKQETRCWRTGSDNQSLGESMSTSQDTSTWFGLPDDPFYSRPKGNQIRVWEPGDGLMCASRNKSSHIRCGVPVAVISSADSRGQRRTDRNLCLIHAANVVRQLVREERNDPGIKTDSQRVAKEMVIAAHWEEYQAAIQTVVEREQEKAFAWLPDSLREAIQAIDVSEVSE